MCVVRCVCLPACVRSQVFWLSMLTNAACVLTNAACVLSAVCVLCFCAGAGGAEVMFHSRASRELNLLDHDDQQYRGWGEVRGS
jgi:hypothetical protein